MLKRQLDEEKSKKTKKDKKSPDVVIKQNPLFAKPSVVTGINSVVCSLFFFFFSLCLLIVVGQLTQGTHSHRKRNRRAS